MMVALLSASDDFDYFGYMKKMMLTLHNVRKINQRQLPIHGAMVKMTLHSGEVPFSVVVPLAIRLPALNTVKASSTLSKKLNDSPSSS